MNRALVLLLLLPMRALATERPLDHFLAEVLAQNPGLQALDLRHTALHTRADAEGRMPDPTINVMVDRFPDRMVEMPMVRWQAQQMLPWPGKLGLMQGAVQAQADQAQAGTNARRLALLQDARRTWWMLAMNAERRGLNKAAEELVDALLRAMRARYAAGTGGHHDLVRAEVERDALRVEKLALDGERVAVVAMLNALRNQADDTDIADPPLDQTPLPPLDQKLLVAQALENRAELQAMAAMHREMTAMADLARRERWPDLMVGAWYNQMIGGPDTFGAMVGANVPIFSIARQGLRAEAFDHEAEAVDREVAAMQAMIRAGIVDALRQVDTATRQVAFLRGSALARADEAFKSALAGYATGSLDVTGLLDARRALQATRRALADAIVARELAIADLDRAVNGKLLEAK